MAKKNNDANTLKRPSMLSFSRAINITEGKLWQTKWEDNLNDMEYRKRVIPIKTKYLLGTKSQNKFEGSDAKRELSDVALDGNPQTTQACNLKSPCNTLLLCFGLKVFPVKEQINFCNNEAYRNRLCDFLDIIKGTEDENDIYYELSQRYVNNIANARFLWRNRRGAKRIITVVSFEGREGTVTKSFSSKDFKIDSFVFDNMDINDIAKAMADALKGNTEFLEISVKCFADIGYGMEVFPSQECLIGKPKTLFSFEGSAGIHSQKIGNAIRTIDTWYPGYSEYGCPIPVEPYGINKLVYHTFRADDSSFYNLIDKYMPNIGEYDEKHLFTAKEVRDDFMFISAVFIRGGLFGSGADKSITPT